MTLEELKEARNQEIDLNTSQLIEVGFIFGGSLFSMSITAQINWSNFPQLPDALFPLHITTKDDNTFILSLANKMNFYFTALSFKNGYLQSGGLLKAAIKAALTIEEVELIIDNRT